jgi:hypothetical protein
MYVMPEGRNADIALLIDTVTFGQKSILHPKENHEKNGRH